MTREQILYYAVKYDGEWARITRAYADNEYWENIEYEGNYITIEDKNYPEELKLLRYAPWILFYEGDINLLNKQKISIIGVRKCNKNGIYNCKKVTDILKKKYVIISGLAKGIDGFAHRYALSDHTIGVIGCGLDVCYPSVNADLYHEMKKCHLILSEYPKGVRPFARHFPWRNRIIAALGEAMVVIQTLKLAGVMLTVDEAIDVGKPIYCIPDISTETFEIGYKELLNKGAHSLKDENDIRLI